MPLKKLLEIVNKLEEGDIKSGLVGELDNLKSLVEKNNKPITLELINDPNNSEYANLRSEILSYKDAEVGRTRNKWEEELKKNLGNEGQIQGNSGESNSDIKKLMTLIENQQKQLDTLTGQKKTDTLKNYALKTMQEKKLKNPEKILSIINLSPDMTESQVNQKIEDSIELLKSLNANISTETDKGSGNGNAGSENVSKVVKDFVNNVKQANKAD